MSDLANKEDDNGTVDAIAATALITVGILGAIHFIYTGGLSAFFDKIL